MDLAQYVEREADLTDTIEQMQLDLAASAEREADLYAKMRENEDFAKAGQAR